MPARKRKTAKALSLSERLESIEEKIDQIKMQQEDTGKEVHQELDAAHHIEDEVRKMEDDLVKIGNFAVGREHVMELARGTAGAFLGVGLGMSIRYIPDMAQSLEWFHAIAILLFIMGFGALLIYKNEKAWIQKEGLSFVPKRLVTLLIISIVVEAITLMMFNAMPSGAELITKTLIVGSYTAMSGAITFTIA